MERSWRWWMIERVRLCVKFCMMQRVCKTNSPPPPPLFFSFFTRAVNNKTCKTNKTQLHRTFTTALRPDFTASWLNCNPRTFVSIDITNWKPIGGKRWLLSIFNHFILVRCTTHFYNLPPGAAILSLAYQDFSQVRPLCTIRLNSSVWHQPQHTGTVSVSISTSLECCCSSQKCSMLANIKYFIRYMK